SPLLLYQRATTVCSTPSLHAALPISNVRWWPWSRRTARTFAVRLAPAGVGARALANVRRGERLAAPLALAVLDLANGRADLVDCQAVLGGVPRGVALHVLARDGGLVSHGRPPSPCLRTSHRRPGRARAASRRSGSGG